MFRRRKLIQSCCTNSSKTALSNCTFLGYFRIACIRIMIIRASASKNLSLMKKVYIILAGFSCKIVCLRMTTENLNLLELVNSMRDRQKHKCDCCRNLLILQNRACVAATQMIRITHRVFQMNLKPRKSLISSPTQIESQVMFGATSTATGSSIVFAMHRSS